MKKRSSVLWIILTFAAFLLVAAAAAPLPPKVIVNHQTRECAIVIEGDECMDCFIPEGWDELGMYGDVECPADYTKIDLRLECQPFKIDRCCTEGHSGARGDCEDMVINRPKRLCAFVEDVNTIQLSGGWQSRPADVEYRNWICPNNFSWESGLLTAEQMQQSGPAWRSLLPVIGLVCLCGFSLLVVGVIVFYLLRQRKKQN
jgi:hypothetical protein